MSLITKAIVKDNVNEAFGLLRDALQLPVRDAIDIPEQAEWYRMRDARRYDVVGHWLRAEALAADGDVTVLVPIGGAAYAKQND